MTPLLYPLAVAVALWLLFQGYRHGLGGERVVAFHNWRVNLAVVLLSAGLMAAALWAVVDRFGPVFFVLGAVVLGLSWGRFLAFSIFFLAGELSRDNFRHRERRHCPRLGGLRRLLDRGEVFPALARLKEEEPGFPLDLELKELLAEACERANDREGAVRALVFLFQAAGNEAEARLIFERVRRLDPVHADRLRPFLAGPFPRKAAT